MHSSSFLLVLVAAASSCWATSCDFTGGFSIRRPKQCGPDTVSCKAGASQRCCPSGFSCFYTEPNKQGNAYCCQDNTDCFKDIESYPQCAHGNRTMWVSEGGNVDQAFCCDVGWQGVIRRDGVGAACSKGEAMGPFETRASTFEAPNATCADTLSTSTDGSGTATSSSSGKTTGEPTKASSGEPTQTSSTDPSSDTEIDTDADDDSSIGGGAIAGIVVSSVAGVGLIAAAAFWIFRRRSKGHKEGQKVPYSAVEQGGNHPPEYAAELDTPQFPPQELAGKEIGREGVIDGSRTA